jgi:serine/threonine-protein kinase
MAPESIENFKESGFPADVWAIAAIVYELLSGKKPYGGKLLNIPDILRADPPAKPSAISGLQFKELGEELYSIILSCMQRDPALRPTAAQLVRNCEDLAYSAATFETGAISKRLAPSLGFLSPDKGKGVAWHRDSFYGSGQIEVGDRVWYARTPGSPNDRAFPIVRLRKPTTS